MQQKRNTYCPAHYTPGAKTKGRVYGLSSRYPSVATVAVGEGFRAANPARLGSNAGSFLTSGSDNIIIANVAGYPVRVRDVGTAAIGAVHRRSAGVPNHSVVPGVAVVPRSRIRPGGALGWDRD